MTMDTLSKNFIAPAEIVKDRVFFVTVRCPQKMKDTVNTVYVCFDDDLVYENFYEDFGPLNLSKLYRYCVIMNKTLNSIFHSKKKLIHYTSMNSEKRVNAAFLAGSYSMLCFERTDTEAYEMLTGSSDCPPFVMFRDASMNEPYQISLKDCLSAVYKCHQLGFFDFRDFNFKEYEELEKVENGDLNWILPGKFIAFCGPHASFKVENGYLLHAPESYFDYFREHNVSTIVRLNRMRYDATCFTNAGFDHKDLFFVDGSPPTIPIVRHFLKIAEKASGAVAVHCKAGLGRTGTLIACYIMKHYHLTAHETIAWIRICRPGSVIGHQQKWLEENEAYLHLLRKEPLRSENGNPVHEFGIYSKVAKTSETSLAGLKNSRVVQNNVSGIMHRVDAMKLEDSNATTASASATTKLSSLTQGDKLNQIKARRTVISSSPVAVTNSARPSPIMHPYLEPLLHGRGAKEVRVTSPLSNAERRSYGLPSVRRAISKPATQIHNNNNTAINSASNSISKPITRNHLIDEKKLKLSFMYDSLERVLNKDPLDRNVCYQSIIDNGGLVNASSENPSRGVRSKPSTLNRDSSITTLNPANSVSSTKPVTRSSVKTSRMAEAHATASPAAIPLNERNLRSSDRINGYFSLKHARTTKSYKKAFIR